MLLYAVAKHLDSLGLVVFGRAGNDCFVQDLPADPVQAVGIYAQPGPAARPWAAKPGIQVICRGDGSNGRARTGYELAEDIQKALDGTRSETWDPGGDDEVRVAWCLATQAIPVGLGQDDNGQPKWSVRFDVEIEVA